VDFLVKYLFDDYLPPEVKPSCLFYTGIRSCSTKASL